MTDFDGLAKFAVAWSGVPDGEADLLAIALKNGEARDKALEDPYWRDLANLEAENWSMQGNEHIEESNGRDQEPTV